MVYVIYQREECPRTKRHHYQGYIQLEKPQYYTYLKRTISANVHLEVQRAPSSDQARDYCLKDRTAVDGPWEFGEYEQVVAKRKLIADFRDDILNGVPEAELWTKFPTQMARYPRMFDTLYSYGNSSAIPRVIPRRTTVPDITVLIGSTGCGKTRYAFDHESAVNLYEFPIQHGTSFWADHYSGQPAVLFDEFTGNMPLRRLLKLTDRYTIMLPRKGSFVLWQPERIYITSNLTPLSWYKWISEDGLVDRTAQRMALYRRITRVLAWNGLTFTTYVSNDYDMVAVM